MIENAGLLKTAAVRKFRTSVVIAACAVSLCPHAQAEPLQSLQKQPDGAILSFGRDQLRLQALAPDVIRVRYNADGIFPPQRVPVLLTGKHSNTAFRLREDATSVTLTAGSLRANVDRKTGAVEFLDASGRRVVGEVPGARSLTPVTLPISGSASTENSCKAHDAFDLASGESLYGLGQHQDGRLDHRGTSVSEEQSNREVAIPFLVSNRGYGLLWNDAAHTDIFAGSHSEVISETALEDDNGKPGGLTGHYFLGTNFETPVHTQIDPGVDFVWSNTPPSGLPHDNYSVRWTGFVRAARTGDYTFQTRADDGARLWIDGRPVINDWKVHPVTTDEAKVHFAAGSRHAIRMEYFQGGGDALVSLSWSGPSAHPQVTWTSEAADTIDYTVFYGPSLDRVIAEYRHATGEAPLIPKWALGLWQSKERYSTQQELLDVAQGYRSRQEPLDNIVQDWFYWDPHPWGSHEFDAKRYPDPAAAIKTLHDQDHVHIMISVWGKFDPDKPNDPDANYNELNAKGLLYPTSVRGPDRFYDAFSPEARAIYWRQMRDALFTKGFDAWWLDASEPEVNMQAFRRTETAAGLGARVLNAWPLMHTMGVSEGQRRDAPNKRVFILTRSAYAGQQRTGAATWSGDITASWDVFARQIPAGLNFCLSGIPYWTTDIGGFFVPSNTYPGGSSNPAYRELFTRWFEYGAFCPLFRVHGTDTSKELWRFGPDTEKTLVQYDKLRYRLMPYIYSEAWQVTHNGGTIMRALVMDFPSDATACKVRDEFLFGPSILVCPVIQPNAVTRSVYLPAGTGWTDYWTGKHERGGQTITADAPIDKMPLFIRDGAIIPFGPEIQYVAEKPADPIDIRVYPGSDSTFTIYEDEGDNTNYLQGRYATIPITWNEQKKMLTVGPRIGSFPGMLESRTFTVVKANQGTAGAPSAATTIIYNGKAQIIHL